MAYKWNSFVKSAQQVKNLVDNKTYWKDIVKSKVKANSLAVIKKRQLFNLLKSIGNGNAFYN
jgi:hydroxymethylglutaryl-CoA reductase